MGAHFAPPPPAAVSRVLSRYDRDQLAAFITVAIDLLDLTDGDTDLETEGLEDDFMRHHPDGPGCPVADRDGCPAHDDDLGRLFGDDKPGDPDDQEDDDPAATDIDGGEGEGDFGRGILPERPIYTLDQRSGPINYASAERERIARERGLVRSPTGGWTTPHSFCAK